MSCSVLHCDETATVNPLPVDNLSIAKERVHRSVCVCMSAGCRVTVAAYICVRMYVLLLKSVHGCVFVRQRKKDCIFAPVQACVCIFVFYVCVCECWGEVVCAIAAKQLSANQYSQASVSGCQEWSENSAKLLQTCSGLKCSDLAAGCNLRKPPVKWSCYYWLLLDTNTLIKKI